jgi:hypothetical protein
MQRRGVWGVWGVGCMGCLVVHTEGHMIVPLLLGRTATAAVALYAVSQTDYVVKPVRGYVQYL